MTLGGKIKQLRESKKYSQEELADLLKIHSVTVSKWETGLQEPRAKRLNDLAKIFGVNSEYFFDNEPAPGAAPKNPGENLPISNAPETSSDDLDLGFWGSVVERAERAARSNDNGKKTLIAGMLDMAKNAITGSEGATAEKTQGGVLQKISGGIGNKNEYNA